jgi:hypothetical protein
MLLVALLLCASGSTADMRSGLQADDLTSLLRARGEACAGCTHAQLVGKLQSTDAAAKGLAQKGMLDIVVR